MTVTNRFAVNNPILFPDMLRYVLITSRGWPAIFPIEKNFSRLSDEKLSSDIPAELAQDIAKRIRDAAEMGDVTTLNAITEEIRARSDSCISLRK